MQEQEEMEGGQGDNLPLAGTKSVKSRSERGKMRKERETQRGRKVLCGGRNQTARIAISAYF